MAAKIRRFEFDARHLSAQERTMLGNMRAFSPSVQQFMTAVVAVAAEHGKARVVELCTDVLAACRATGK
jgi:hypothetical protein